MSNIINNIKCMHIMPHESILTKVCVILYGNNHDYERSITAGLVCSCILCHCQSRTTQVLSCIYNKCVNNTDIEKIIFCRRESTLSNGASA